MPPKRRDREATDAGDNSRRHAGIDDETTMDDVNGLVFEDPFGDDFEEEDCIDDDDDEDREDGGMIVDDDAGDDEEGHGSAKKQVWRPGVDQLEDGEALEYDPSAYVMYHSLKLEWPCLTFDILRDSLGDGRQRVRLIHTSMFSQ